MGLLTLAIQGTASDLSPIKFAPPDSWVKPHFFNPSSPRRLDSSADQHWLLWERQINAVQNETFVHSVRQILTTAGVQNSTTLTINFNPSYQALIWHWARIWRGKQHLNRLNTNNIRIVQQEQDLDQSILNGDETVILVLDDVRVGDIIDYAYSLKGANPVFSAHFSCAVPLEMDQPVDRLLTCVLWPKQKLLYTKMHGRTVEPRLITRKKTIEYVWDLKHVPGYPLEDSLPAWCDPEPWVQLTDSKTWAAVNQWALALFHTSGSLSPELSRKIAAWKQIPNREQQILTALRFVQDDVRYFGIEIGVSAEKPANPSVVFSRRFGDCKDKSLLFVTILRALGFEAYPVLVNATVRRAIENWRPSASAFDHCITVVRYRGRLYWLDPTMNYQRGPLAAHYLPNYGCGLVISPRTTRLTIIPQTTGLPKTTTTEYFQIRRKRQPAELKVVTIAEGRDADSLRELFATTKRSDIEKRYAHFYSDLYPGIKVSKPITIEDDQQQDRVQTTEYYTIERAWTGPDKGRKYRFEFYPHTIAALLQKPVDTNRKLPLGISFPQHQILHVVVTLPRTWPFSTGRKNISDPAFTFRSYYRCAGNKLVMNYDYQSLTDSVSSERINQCLQRVDQCSQSLGYTLTWR